MDSLPLHFNLQSRLCLIVGGGEQATAKARLVRAAGAHLRVVSPAITDELQDLAGTQDEVRNRRFEEADIEDIDLVICATDDEDLNARVARLAQSRHIPVNVVDNGALCTVTFPAIVDRSPVVVSVGTGGSSPILARRIREQLEKVLPGGLGRLATFLRGERASLKAKFPDVGHRRRVVERFLDSVNSERVLAGALPTGDPFESSDDDATGEVFLVGAGPGDPDLLTLRALQLMQLADVVLYDNLVSDDILDRVRRDAARVYVGKRGRDESTPQETINDLLVRLAGEGKRVLRLKGGDPFIFGRGGEEIEHLADHGIAFQVVPGITAAAGCASYAGIPLTHRDYAQSVRFVTGHPKDGHVVLEWQEFVHDNQTIVFYMGLGGLASICEQLVAHGKSPKTPVALISKGTLPDQSVVIGDLESMPATVAALEVETPTLIIVGDVVRLHGSLAWRR